MVLRFVLCSNSLQRNRGCEVMPISLVCVTINCMISRTGGQATKEEEPSPPKKMKIVMECYRAFPGHNYHSILNLFNLLIYILLSSSLIFQNDPNYVQDVPNHVQDPNYVRSITLLEGVKGWFGCKNFWSPITMQIATFQVFITFLWD